MTRDFPALVLQVDGGWQQGALPALVGAQPHHSELPNALGLG